MWFQRRQTLQAAATWIALGGWSTSFAQSRSNIVELEGDALVNGQRLEPNGTVQSGDVIETGPQSRLVFVVGHSAFHVRQNSRLVVDRGPTLNTVSTLRLLTGAVVGVWGKGSQRRLVTPTLTVNTRGTGMYTEIFTDQDNSRSYVCNCYGKVDLVTHADKRTLAAEYHQAMWATQQSDGNVMLMPAQPINHTDEELEFLARLINQPTAWQITGRKGNTNGPYDG